MHTPFEIEIEGVCPRIESGSRVAAALGRGDLLPRLRLIVCYGRTRQPETCRPCFGTTPILNKLLLPRI
jgi:hypothetical protein